MARYGVKFLLCEKHGKIILILNSIFRDGTKTGSDARKSPYVHIYFLFYSLPH